MRRIALGVSVVAAMLVALATGTPPQTDGWAVAEPSVRITASSTAGGAASRLASFVESRRATWTSSGRLRGTWLETRFARPTVVDGLTVRGAGGSLRIRDARFQFSDGSVLAVRTTAQGDRQVSFAPRRVRWVRLVVAGTAAGQRSVGLVGWTLRRGVSAPALRPRGDAVASATTRASSGELHDRRWTASSPGPGQWVEARWPRPVEVSAVRLIGAAPSSAATVRSAILRFSDGSTVPVGTLEPADGAPTTIAFTPRTTTSVRVQVTGLDASAHAALRRFSVFAVGTRPAAVRPTAPTFRALPRSAASCARAAAPRPTARLTLRCPTNGSAVGARLQVVLSGPVGARVRATGWAPRGTGGALIPLAAARVGADGTARLDVSTRRLANGPTAIRIAAAGVAEPLYVQLVNRAGVRAGVPAASSTRGMDLKLDEQFTAPLSITRTGAGAQYASAKPNGYGSDEFGDAIFAQPTLHDPNPATVPGGYLRIRSSALRPGQKDPGGFGRRAVGGLVSSGHLGGSGFSAQYGYFEARMLGPAGKGTWPAFWLLSAGSLYTPNASTAEVDAVELYGDNTAGACQTAHSWVGGRDVLGKGFCRPLGDRRDWALQWHTYGARVTPTGTDFYIDGVRTAHAPPVVDNSQPFFFLVNLALGGGWPVDLQPTGSQVDLYVDYVKVWV